MVEDFEASASHIEASTVAILRTWILSTLMCFDAWVAKWLPDRLRPRTPRGRGHEVDVLSQALYCVAEKEMVWCGRKVDCLLPVK